jgi:hypothetical protein
MDVLLVGCIEEEQANKHCPSPKDAAKGPVLPEQLLLETFDNFQLLILVKRLLSF